MVKWIVNSVGGRKMVLGVMYLVGGIGCVITALVTKSEAAIILAVASAFVSFATGLGVVVWGTVEEHKTGKGDA